jgi:hypothetical protein
MPAQCGPPGNCCDAQANSPTAWTSGVRKPYVAPFQLFLIANVLFFAMQWLTGENVFSSSLDSHLHHQD